MNSAGVRFGECAVEAAELTGSRKSLRIVRAVRKTIEPGVDPGLALGEALASAGIRPRRVCITLPGEGAVVRRMTIPVKNPGALAKAVRFQAEDLLCDASLEDVVVEHQVLGPAGESGTEVLALIVRKSEVGQALSVARVAGFEPSCVTIDAAAILAVARASGSLPESGVAAVLDVDGSITQILVVRDGNAAAYRCARRADCDDPAGASAGELARTLAGEGIEGPPLRVLVFGDGASGVASAVSSRMAVEAEALDPAALFHAPPGTVVSAAAAGAALITAGAAAITVNFMKGEFAPTGESRKIRKRFAFAAAGLAVLLAVLLASSWRRWAAAERYLDNLTREEQKIWKSVFPNKPFPRVGFDKYITDPKLKETRKAGDAPRYASFLDALTRSAQAFPGEGVEVQSMTFDQQKMVIAGEVDSIERFDSLVSSIEARFGVRVKPQMEKRGKPGKDRRTTFKIEIPRRKEGA